MALIVQVEDYILSVVNRVLPVGANGVRGVLRQTGTLPGAWNLEILKRVLQTAPSVWVAFDGGEPRPDCNDPILDARFAVYAVQKEPNELDRRRGAPGDIGAYEMIERLYPALHARTINGVGTLRAKTVRNMYGEDALDLGGTVYGLLLGIGLTLPVLPDPPDPESGLGSFRHYHGDWDIPPFAAAADRDRWVQGDHDAPAPDAQDDVQLEGA
jgi:phage gp37-like protein